MSGQRYTPEFKEEAVKLITERGYSVTDVAERLGVSQHRIYKWLKVYNLYASILMNMNFSKLRKKSYALKVSLNKLKRNGIC